MCIFTNDKDIPSYVRLSTRKIMLFNVTFFNNFKFLILVICHIVKCTKKFQMHIKWKNNNKNTRKRKIKGR